MALFLLCKKNELKTTRTKTGMVACTYNPTNWEGEAGGYHVSERKQKKNPDLKIMFSSLKLIARNCNIVNISGVLYCFL